MSSRGQDSYHTLVSQDSNPRYASSDRSWNSLVAYGTDDLDVESRLPTRRTLTGNHRDYGSDYLGRDPFNGSQRSRRPESRYDADDERSTALSSSLVQRNHVSLASVYTDDPSEFRGRGRGSGSDPLGREPDYQRVVNEARERADGGLYLQGNRGDEPYASAHRSSDRGSTADTYDQLEWDRQRRRTALSPLGNIYGRSDGYDDDRGGGRDSDARWRQYGGGPLSDRDAYGNPWLYSGHDEYSTTGRFGAASHGLYEGGRDNRRAARYRDRYDR